MLHPEHDLLCAEVRSWYQTSSPAFQVTRARYGFYRRNPKVEGSAHVIVGDATPLDLATLLAEAREYFGGCEFDLWIDDRSKDAVLGPALTTAGWVRSESTVYLAHVVEAPDEPKNTSVTIEPITAATLRDFVVVKLQGFANSDGRPTEEQLAQEMVLKEQDFRGPGRFLTARVKGEIAAILGFYEGNADRLIFNLATRVPFRMKGIAKLLLDFVLADSRKKGCRSVIINTNPDDTPIEWYRRIGFTDEVYWHRKYVNPGVSVSVSSE
jgi:ribosomal protein S18 acetylase RimI-like enzyme